ncbi:MAG: hypothetical protein JRI68_00260 [Deltaproteobacteria bacterium]|nr:hypothetical protein [Deltaproteobacteria bacterium]
MSSRTVLAAAVVLSTSIAACVVADESVEADESDLTSKSAVFLELSFAGEAIAPRDEDAAQRRRRMESQMFYLAGELDKTYGAHGRFGYVELDNVTIEPLDEQLEVVHYDARLPVAWPKHRAVPETYRVVLPKRIDDAGLREFNSKYAGTCAKAKYGEDALWYDFKPVTTEDCELDPVDVVDVEAGVAESPYTTTGRYPEFPKFWEDGEFRMVLVHGTDSASSEDPSDFIAAEYIEFKEKLVAAHPDATITEGDTTYSIYDDWRFEATVPMYGGGEGKLVVHGLLTSPLKYIGADFDERFDPISGDADIIAYGGHSGLSKNIKALASKGIVKEQAYQVMMFQGCSTFAYLDRSVNDRRIELNGVEIDPLGTKFLDVVVTARPAYAYTNSPSFWTVLTTLSGTEALTYDDMLEAMPQQAIPLVAGEEDNPETAP